jgi:Glutathione S-transferase, C-terminal domain
MHRGISQEKLPYYLALFEFSTTPDAAARPCLAPSWRFCCPPPQNTNRAYQGIGRYEPDAAYARGIADLGILANLLPPSGFLFGANPSSIDAAIYGFVANICFYGIDTPLKDFLVSRSNLVAHCRSIHTAVTSSP